MSFTKLVAGTIMVPESEWLELQAERDKYKDLAKRAVDLVVVPNWQWDDEIHNEYADIKDALEEDK